MPILTIIWGTSNEGCTFGAGEINEDGGGGFDENATGREDLRP